MTFRGYAGRVAGGIFKKGDKVVALPSGLESAISGIHTLSRRTRRSLSAPMSVTITLEDDIDISRGDMLVRSENRPDGTTRLRCDVVLA